MEYLLYPHLVDLFRVNVGKCAIHGSHGMYTKTLLTELLTWVLRYFVDMYCQIIRYLLGQNMVRTMFSKSIEPGQLFSKETSSTLF